MKLVWTLRARRDLSQIGRYVSLDSPRRARLWLTKLRDSVRRVLRHPRIGRVVPELRRPDIRELVEGNYRIVYVVTEPTIAVLTVFEAHRLLPAEVTVVTPRGRPGRRKR